MQGNGSGPDALILILGFAAGASQRLHYIAHSSPWKEKDSVKALMSWYALLQDTAYMLERLEDLGDLMANQLNLQLPLVDRTDALAFIKEAGEVANGGDPKRAISMLKTLGMLVPSVLGLCRMRTKQIETKMNKKVPVTSLVTPPPAVGTIIVEKPPKASVVVTS